MGDVAYFLCNSLPIELRRKEERDLLMRYRDGLDAAGAEVPTFDETWRDYRRFALYSWVSAATTAAAGSRMQPIEVFCSCPFAHRRSSPGSRGWRMRTMSILDSLRINR